MQPLPITGFIGCMARTPPFNTTLQNIPNLSPGPLLFKFNINFTRNSHLHPNSSVGIVTRVLPGQQRDLCSALRRFRNFDFSKKSERCLRPTQPSTQNVPAAFPPGLKWSGNKADQPTQSSTDLRRRRSITPLFHTSSWHGTLRLWIDLSFPINNFPCLCYMSCPSGILDSHFN